MKSIYEIKPEKEPVVNTKRSRLENKQFVTES